ncbi:MAG: heme exporter protein CcmD [Ancalomicrobiaceae bacterium]|nr:heme exporter protein CcmD [Ancalomicrobiaceae bacterium]
MLPSLGPHAGFILAAYAVFLVAVIGVVVWIVLDGRQLSRQLAELEARGIRRRGSDKKPDAVP